MTPIDLTVTRNVDATAAAVFAGWMEPRLLMRCLEQTLDKLAEALRA